MPRFTLFRSVTCFVLFWICSILVWAFIPSPSYEHPDDPNGYSTHVVSRGKVLTRSFDRNDFFPFESMSAHFPDKDQIRGTFSMDISVFCNKHSNLPVLKIGDSFLERPATDLSISSPLYISVKAGEFDGVSLPWFYLGDNPLLFWNYAPEDDKYPFRLRVKSKGVFELWPDHAMWDGQEQPPYTAPLPTNVVPLFTIDTSAMYSSGCHLETVKMILPENKWSASPSMTFPIRAAVANLLFPTIEAAIAACSFFQGWVGPLLAYTLYLAFWFALIYPFVVAIVWVAEGRPPLRPWVQQSMMTRWIVGRAGSSRSRPRRRRVRRSHRVSDTNIDTEKGIGASLHDDPDQPLNEDEDEDEYTDEEYDDEFPSDAPRPERPRQQLTSVFAFFTSDSPLDDLLFTFNATKWMVQPMEWRRRYQSHVPGHADDDEESSLHTVPAGALAAALESNATTISSHQTTSPTPEDQGEVVSPEQTNATSHHESRSDNGS